MKRIFGYAIVLASLSIPAFAAKNSQTVAIDTPVKVGTTELPAGNYKVTWTGTGSTAQVTIAQKGKASVTAPAKLTEQKNNQPSITTNTVNGATILQSIQLNNVTLSLASAATTGE
jgi:hypothetical protein